MKFGFRNVLIGVGIILVLAVGGFVVWAQDALGPGEQAIAALEMDSNVSVTLSDDSIVFKPAGVEPDTGLIFYPGGRVDYRSYAPPLWQIASQGYLVVLVSAPLNLMVFDPNKAGEIIPQFPQIKHWVVGGHSLGGAMAANYLYNHPDSVEGLALWASYPAKNNDLSKSGVNVLSIYGSLDMAGMEPFDASRALLPPDTTWVLIEGGNHAQFGDYGPQPGDNPATISAVNQQAQVVAVTTTFLNSLDQ